MTDTEREIARLHAEADRLESALAKCLREKTDLKARVAELERQMGMIRAALRGEG